MKIAMFFINISIRSIYVPVLTYFWYEYMILWTTVDFKNSNFFYGEKNMALNNDLHILRQRCHQPINTSTYQTAIVERNKTAYKDRLYEKSDKDRTQQNCIIRFLLKTVFMKNRIKIKTVFIKNRIKQFCCVLSLSDFS